MSKGINNFDCIMGDTLRQQIDICWALYPSNYFLDGVTLASSDIPVLDGVTLASLDIPDGVTLASLDIPVSYTNITANKESGNSH